MIIGLVGYKRSGKNTVAKFLSEQYEFYTYALAGPIKDMCKIAFTWDDRHTEGELKETVDPYWGISPRQAMQWLGTEAFQFYLPNDFPCFEEVNYRNVWVRRFVKWYNDTIEEMSKYISNVKFDVVITDVRFPHEVKIINQELAEFNPQFIRVNRKGIAYGADMHESEIHIDHIPVRAEIYNNGEDIEEFHKQIKDFFDHFFVF